MDRWLRRSMFVILSVGLVLVLSGVYYQLNTMNAFAHFSWRAFRTFLSWFFAVYIFLIMVFIFFENRNPSRMIAWLLILAAFPGVGFVFYILFGRNIRKKRRSNRKRRADEDRMAYSAAIQKSVITHVPYFQEMNSPVATRVSALLLENNQAPFLINNHVEVFTEGNQAFAKILSAIEGANQHIHLDYYIIRDDNIGRAIQKKLIKKVQDGVEVRVIYDSVGCWRLSSRYIQELKEAGAQVYPFFPVAFPIFSRELNYRNHRKIIVVDGYVGFVGGMNIGDEYLGKNKNFGFWRDTHIQIEGEAVYGLQDIFLNDWNFVSGQDVKGEVYFPKQKNSGKTIIQVASSGPDSPWPAIEQGYFSMIGNAQKRVYLTTPYLVPEQSHLQALKTAALSGVDVRILIPNKPDHLMVYWASQDNIQTLLEAGVRIYAYEKGFVHGKVIVVDSQVASVGTANFDVRSFKMNFEVNAFIYDDQVAQKLESDFFNDIKDAEEIDYETHMNRSIKRRFMESLGRLVSPLQ